jgi:predicted AlkP superfamily pyrophosphatase or phosphodiesterase
MIQSCFKAFIIGLLMATFPTLLTAQERPRLVIGLVVDQMRYDYLYRYWNDLEEGGFKRMLREGHIVHNGHFQYAPTFTGPGHASNYAGTGPAMHGIVANDWYDRQLERTVYCVEDENAKTVGSESVDGQMSPRRLMSTTLADQLELATNYRSKTIGIAIKDRGSILPLGHLGDAAFWYDKSVGKFISSDFYADTLPAWLTAFNARNLSDQYLALGWSPLLPMDRYEESLPDDKPGERPYRNTEKAVFPYDLIKISSTKRFGQGEQKYDLLAGTPHGNTLTLDMAKAAILGEQMGKDDVPDLLAVSFSSTDYAGHQFGPSSVEIHDMYLRLDRDLAEFFQFIDAEVGMENTLIFLSSDHGAADNPALISPPGGYFLKDSFETGLRQYLMARTDSLDPIEYFTNEQIYFRQPLQHSLEDLTRWVREYALNFPGVHHVIALNDLSSCTADERFCNKIRQGIKATRSGDLYIQLSPGWIKSSYRKGGTTHGSAYYYDTHAPIIFMGAGIQPMDNYDRVWIEDIAPTISTMLRIAAPSACTGQPIGRLFEGR